MKKINLKQILNPKKPLRIHIIACAGHLSAPLTLNLKELGHQITGSDQKKIYPPATTLFKKNKIPINKFPLTSQTDLVIVGTTVNNFKKLKEEYQKAKNLNLKTIPITKFIAGVFERKNNITVAGAYGKTTITALIAWILKNLDLNPSYMFGTPALDIKKPLKINDSDWSVLEGDESINGLDTKAKFLYYPKKYVIITSTHWEHKDSYSTSQKNLKAYQNLVKQIPKNGCLVINKKDPHARNLKKLCRAPVIFYNQTKKHYQTHLLGQHNQENIDAAVTLCLHLGFKKQTIKESISRFKGLKRRLEKLGEHRNIIFYDDFAQSVPRFNSILKTLKNKYPKKKIKIFFEPRASHLQFKKNLKGLNTAFRESEEVVLGKISFSQKVKKRERSTFTNYQQELGAKVKYIPLYPQILKHYRETLKPGDLLLHFSSGGTEGLKTLKKIINYFK